MGPAVTGSGYGETPPAGTVFEVGAGRGVPKLPRRCERIPALTRRCEKSRKLSLTLPFLALPRQWGQQLQGAGT
eukprot:6765645-Pyramimonas_sp.AAC.1